jgi:HK97 gp10 family phage protein
MKEVIFSPSLVKEGLQMARRTKEQLAKAWAKIPDEVMKKVQRAVQANAKELKQVIEAVAPKDTGELAHSIKMIDKTSNKARPQAYVATESQGKSHAGFVEFGTERTTADPFFFITYRILKPKMRRRTKSAFTRGIKAALNNG